MFTRDYILRQIHQLILALQRTLYLRTHQQEIEALREIDEAFSGDPGLHALARNDLSREELLDVCRFGGDMKTEYAVAVADLLYERAFMTSDRERLIASAQYAAWLYAGASRAPGAALPLDLADRLDALSALLDDARQSPTNPYPAAD